MTSFSRYSAWVLLPFAFLSHWWLSSPPQDKTFEKKTGTQWYPFLEWSMENPTYEGNPFDLKAKAVFMHQESGQTLTTPMFYDGENTWHFRFTGTKTGTWTLRTFSSDEDLGGWSGRAEITENPDPEAHGFMKTFGSKWGWQGTETAFVPQYVMGQMPAAYLTEDGRVDTALVERAIQEYVEGHGFTGFNIPVEGDWFAGENPEPQVYLSRNVSPGAGQGENPDPQTYRVVERLVREVHRRGGACHIWFWGSGQHGANDTENGWATREELNDWKSFLEAQMGYDHFIGARVGYDRAGLLYVRPRPPRPLHNAKGQAPIADKYTSWLGGDYIGYTSYRPLYPRYVQAIYHHPDMPSMEEDRFRLRDAERWSFKDYTPELTRRSLWHSAMAGGVANIWGNMLPYRDNILGSKPYPSELKRQIKTYARFFEKRFLKEMQTEYEGPELRLSTPDASHTIVYREDTDLVRLDLERMKGSQPAVAVDAKKAYEEIDIGALAPGEHTWEAPYRSDWAIAVGRFEE